MYRVILLLAFIFVLSGLVKAVDPVVLPSTGLTLPLASDNTGGTAARQLTVAQSATFYLQLAATLPTQLGLETIPYTFTLDGKPIRASAPTGPNAGAGWNQGYMPYFLVEGDGAVKQLTSLLPVTLAAGAHTLQIAVPDGSRVEELRLLPAIPALEVALQVDGDSRVVFPGEAAKARVRVIGGEGAAALHGEMVFQRLRLADAGNSSEWGPDIREAPVETISRVPLAGGETVVDFPTARHGLIGASVVMHDGGGSIFAAYLGAVAVTPRRDITRCAPDGLFLASTTPATTPSRLRDYRRAGIDWLRVELGPAAFVPNMGQLTWEGLDRFFNACRAEKLQVMTLLGGSPAWMQPTGQFVDIPYKTFTFKLDGAPGREFLDDWEQAWTAYLLRYRDVNRAMNLWNEPWEGGGISGWKSTGTHYRQLLTHLVAARNAVDKQIKIVAADSSPDTDWKIFAAHRQDDIDVISTHYEHPRASTAFAMARYYHKEVWETETWECWEGDAASVRRILYELALGARRISLWTDPMLFDGAGNPTPELVTLATTRAMLDGLTFTKIIHPERPPFVLLFTGKGRQVAAVVSTLALTRELANQEFRGQFAYDRLTMTVADPHEEYRVYDLLANPMAVTRRNGAVQLPVDADVRYIESRSSASAFARRLSAAACEGMRPVEIVLHDLPMPLAQHPTLRVTLRNAYPVRLPATVTVQAQHLTLQPAARRVILPAGAELTLAFPIAAAEPVSGNVYPVHVSVATEKGEAHLDELVSVATITRGTPPIDSNWRAWAQQGAVPVYVLPARGKTPAALTPWLPQVEWEKAMPIGGAEVAFMADARCLYMLARVRDITPHMFPSLLRGDNLHVMQHTPADYVYYRMGPWPERDGDLVEISLGAIDRRQWERKYEVFPPSSPLYRFGAALPCLYTYVCYPMQQGGAELLRLRTPDFYYAHPLPMDYAWLAAHCRVEGAQVYAQRDANGYLLQAAIPWSELRALPHAPGTRIRLNIRVRDANDTFPLAWAGSTEAGGRQYAWSQGRSIAGIAALDYTPAGSWQWSADTEWGFAEENK